MDGVGAPLRVALVAIARPTFDVALAQETALAAVAQLEAEGVEVVGSRECLIMDSGAAQTALETLAAQACDLLVLFQATFADSTMAVQLGRAAHSRGTPVLLWATPDARDGGRLRLNSLCGINLAGHALSLHTIPCDYLFTPPGTPAVGAKVRTLARAGRARRILAGATVGVVGEHPAGFETCAYDAEHLATLLGVQVQPIPLKSLLSEAALVGAEERTAFVGRVREVAPNVAELDDGAVRGTAGVYAALSGQVQRHNLNGIAVRCWPEFFTELGCAACGAMSMLGEEGCPASCEADVHGTVTSLLLQALSGQQAFLADLVSIDTESDTGVLWHCGLAPMSMADESAPVRATIHSNRKLPLLFEFALKPGRVTIARLHRASLEGGTAGYQLLVGGGEMVSAPISFGGTSGVLRFDKPAGEVLDTILRRGVEHHLCITYGDVRAELRDFARLVGMPVLELT